MKRITFAFNTLLVIALICPQHCAAQAFQKPVQSYVSLGNDMRYYEIIYHEDDKDYVTYADAVREKIKHSLKGRYERYYREGDVTFFFIIRSDGTLVKVDIDDKNSTSDTRLIDIVVRSMRGSSPFPPFPKELTDGELPFTLTISFTKNAAYARRTGR